MKMVFPRGYMNYPITPKWTDFFHQEETTLVVDSITSQRNDMALCVAAEMPTSSKGLLADPGCCNFAQKPDAA